MAQYCRIKKDRIWVWKQRFESMKAKYIMDSADLVCSWVKLLSEISHVPLPTKWRGTSLFSLQNRWSWRLSSSVSLWREFLCVDLSAANILSKVAFTPWRVLKNTMHLNESEGVASLIRLSCTHKNSGSLLQGRDEMPEFEATWIQATLLHFVVIVIV